MRLLTSKNNTVFIVYAFAFLISFVFWGMQSIMITNIGPELFSKDYLYSIFGTFVFFSFGSTLVGGILADRYIGHYNASLVGALSLLLGVFCLSIKIKFYCILGVALNCIGYAFLSTNKTVLLNSLFNKNTEDNCRKAFNISYAFTNAGALLGPVFFGFMLKSTSWNTIFAYFSIVFSFWFFIFIKMKPSFKITTSFTPAKSIFSAIIVFFMSFTFFYGFQFPNIVYGIAFFISVLVGIYLLYLIYTRDDHKNILTITVLTIFLIIFYGIFFQINSFLLPIYETLVNKNIFAIDIPSSVFVSIEPGFVVVISPIVTALLFFKNKKNYLLKSVFVAFVLEGVAFLIFALAFKDTSHKVSIIWPLLSCFVLAIAEIYISPTTSAAIAMLAPDDLKGTLVGISRISLGFSGVISGYIATNLSQSHENISLNFILLSLISVTFGIIAALGIKLKVVNNNQ